MTALELAHGIYAAFGTGNLDGVLSLLSDDVEWSLIGPKTIPYFGNYRGKAGVQSFFKLLLESEEILEFVPEQFIDGGSSVVAIGHERCRCRATGREYRTQWAQVFEARDGKIYRWREFIDTAPMVSAFVK